MFAYATISVSSGEELKVYYRAILEACSYIIQDKISSTSLIALPALLHKLGDPFKSMVAQRIKNGQH